MQSFRIVSAIAAIAMFAPGAALSQESAAKPAIDWSCEGDRCVVRMAASPEDMLRQCKRTVRVTGPVSSYRVGDRELTGAELRACNRFVIATQPARN